jgi:hypothetical protein
MPGTRRNPPTSMTKSSKAAARGPHNAKSRRPRRSGFGSWPLIVATLSSTASLRRRALRGSDLRINAIE